MSPPPVYERTFLVRPENLVVVKIVARAGEVLAEVTWPANASTAGGDYFYPTHVPLALDRAEDVRQNYGFRAVVIFIDDLSLWDAEWGTLI